MTKHRRNQGLPALLAVFTLLIPLLAACGGAAATPPAPTTGAQAEPTAVPAAAAPTTAAAPTAAAGIRRVVAPSKVFNTGRWPQNTAFVEVMRDP